MSSSASGLLLQDLLWLPGALPLGLSPPYSPCARPSASSSLRPPSPPPNLGLGPEEGVADVADSLVQPTLLIHALDAVVRVILGVGEDTRPPSVPPYCSLTPHCPCGAWNVPHGDSRGLGGQVADMGREGEERQVPSASSAALASGREDEDAPWHPGLLCLFAVTPWPG